MGSKKTDAISEERTLQYARIYAEIEKLMRETSKLNAETAKLATENRLYFLVLGSAATLAIVAVTKLLLSSIL